MLLLLLSFVLSSKQRIRILNSSFENIIVAKPDLQSKTCSMSDESDAKQIYAYSGITSYPCSSDYASITNNAWKDIDSSGDNWGLAITIYHIQLECDLVGNKFINLINRRIVPFSGQKETYGGAIYLDHLKILNSNGNHFENCQITVASGKGGGIAVLHTDIVKFDSNTFIYCVNSGGDGGAIYIEGDTSPSMSLTNNVFKKSSSKYGGGVYIKCFEMETQCESSGNFYEECSATQCGAGVYYESKEIANLNINNDTFTNCVLNGQDTIGAGIATSFSGDSNVVISDSSFIQCQSDNIGGGFGNINLGKIDVTICGCLFDSCTAEKAGDAIQMNKDISNVNLVIQGSKTNRTRINSGSRTMSSLISGYADSTNLSNIDFTSANVPSLNLNKCNKLGISSCTFTDCNQANYILQASKAESIWIDQLIFNNCKNLLSLDAGSVIINAIKLLNINEGSSSLSAIDIIILSNCFLTSVKEKISINGNGIASIYNINLKDCSFPIKIGKNIISSTISVKISDCTAINSPLFEINNMIDDCTINNVSASELVNSISYISLKSSKSVISNSSFSVPDASAEKYLLEIQQGSCKIDNCHFSAKSVINLLISGKTTSVEFENNTFESTGRKIIFSINGARLILVKNTNCVPKKFSDSVLIENNGKVVNEKGTQIDKFYPWNNKCFDETPPTNTFLPTISFSSSVVFSQSDNFNFSQDFTHSAKFVQSLEFSQSLKFIASHEFSKSHQFKQSDQFNESSHFSQSNHFIPSNQFTQSDKQYKIVYSTNSNKISPTIKLSPQLSQNDQFDDYEAKRTEIDSFNPQISSYIIKTIQTSKVIKLTSAEKIIVYTEKVAIESSHELYSIKQKNYEPDAQIENSDKKTSFGTAAIIGVAIGAVLVVLIIVIAIFIVCHKKSQDKDETSDLETEFENASLDSSYSIDSMQTFAVGGTNPIFTMNGDTMDMYEVNYEENFPLQF